MATTVKQSFQKLKENLEITGLQEETVSTRQKCKAKDCILTVLGQVDKSTLQQLALAYE